MLREDRGKNLLKSSANLAISVARNRWPVLVSNL